MHPPPLPAAPWGYRRDLPVPRPLFGGRSFGQKSFNFRDMSMKRPSTDYFTLQPVRGSSPTSSLAADMSSNLHVDQSPQLATPRRALFTTNLFRPLDNRGTTTPPIARWEGVTTPPIPDSSPCFVPDSMDISPLPHKAPFSLITSLPSPSPDVISASEEDMISPCEPTPLPPQLEVPRPVSAAERRKSILLRPSLVRNKNYSTSTLSFKSRETNPLPAFKFGAGFDSFANASSPSLDECFAASPPRMALIPNMGAAKAKPFSLNTNISRANGSPLSAHVRKPVGPPSRRPSKFRRSLSMFEHPGDVMNSKEDQDNYTPSGLQSVMDIDDSPTLKLPHFTPADPDSLPRITDKTLISVLDGRYNHLYDRTVVIDCRFEYEYQGGHIDGALNFCEKEQLAEELFNAPSNLNTLLIFHCEYSAHRAPLMAKFVRHEDRKVNAFRYPQLHYPEVYILDGGYSSFYESHRIRCFPQNYLKMDAKEHENACERGMNKLRQRTKLNRAQTFAFGQQLCQIEDSPTAVGRSRSGGILTLGGGNDTFSIGRIGATRRMASY
ncbi:M-phase inducer phosphatase-like protein [Amniculicola lignicola CBS 123094]|uniref:M-phase inducer phosphatase n=1 Tax=Amniculicola lignicola CBS 123094 TaxID=1392246 RepID=A0A6A5X4J6_9PLEO|nr:M-phase inducer phosphatase-like protein [Amniculicola lignicola CBS 123094]